MKIKNHSIIDTGPVLKSISLFKDGYTVVFTITTVFCQLGSYQILHLPTQSFI